jgi:osmotically-inducible protein OsmY
MTESIRGVLGAIDLLTVTPTPRPDENIRKDILSALLQDPATESYAVSVSVQNAVTKLTGVVGSHAEQQLAGRIAGGVRGVRDVQNEVTINYQTKRTAQEIDADVQERLQWDIWINGGLISSSVEDGIVTLSGTVGSAVGKSRAFDDAWVHGVFAVHDDGLKIEPWESNVAHQKLTYAVKPDSETTKGVQEILHLDPRVSPFYIEVTAIGGSVSLNGIVGNLKAKVSAEDDAKNIVSVWRVDNYLKVRPKERPADSDMKAQLVGALLWDAALDGTTINAIVENRVASLSGSVDSRFQKDEAQDVASKIKGVLSVRNHLTIDPEIQLSYASWPYDYMYDWDYPSETPSYTSQMGEMRPSVSDEQIKKNIEEHFFWSPYVRRTDVKVTVDAGVATLTGSVGNWIGWGEANNDAQKGGATQIVNHIVVKTGGWWW